MEELFGLIELLDGVSNLEAIGDLTDQLDFFSIEAVDLSALDALEDVGIEDFDLAIGEGSFEVVNTSDWTELAELNPPDGNFAEQLGIESPYLGALADPGIAGDYLLGELNDYPQSIVEGLTHVDYNAEESGDALGFWEPAGDGTASITLNDHVNDLSMTFHHEVGHHFFENNPEIAEAVLEKAEGSPLLETFHFDNLLSQYDPQLWGSEFLAESFAFYKDNPAVLADADPTLFAEIDKWYYLKAQAV